MTGRQEPSWTVDRATLHEVTGIERRLTLLPDPPNVYSEWKRLVLEHKALGSNVQAAFAPLWPTSSRSVVNDLLPEWRGRKRTTN